MEYKYKLLFARSASVIKLSLEIKENLAYEFAKKAPPIFENGLMRKNTKSVLAALLKKISNTSILDKYVID